MHAKFTIQENENFFIISNFYYYFTSFIFAVHTLNLILAMHLFLKVF